MSHLTEKEVFAKTVYAEARGEEVEGQKWVAWVIKNRARMNREYWGGSSIKNVCLKPGQFECWNGKSDIEIHEPQAYEQISCLTNGIYDAPHGNDPTGGADHYNNPNKEGYPDWTNNCNRVRKIGGHQFYKEKSDLSEKEVFAKTVYAEARGEPVKGQKWVAWVIKNRASMKMKYWGGSSIKGVCHKPGQFECWNEKSDIEVHERQAYEQIKRLADAIYDSPPSDDPTGGADHYNNPNKEVNPDHLKNCDRVRKIGNHQFYKSR